MPFFRRVSCLLVLLGACQASGPPPLSLEEARRVTASFEGTGLKPSPRTVNDVLALFPEPDIDPLALEHPDCFGRFTRGAANKRIIAGLEALLKQGGPGDPVEVPAHLLEDKAFAYLNYGRDVLNRLSTMEQERGNIPAAVRYRETYIDTVSRDRRLASDLADLAKIYVEMGNIKKGEEALDRALRQRQTQRLKAPYAIIMITSAEAAVAEAKGDLPRAEARLAEVTQFMRDVEPGNPQAPLLTSGLAQVLARQGRLVEAESAARRALLMLLAKAPRKERDRRHGEGGMGGSHRGHARGVHPIAGTIAHRLSSILHRQGRFADAEAVARVSINILQRNCTPPHSVQIAEARRSLADSLIAQGRWSEAASLFDGIEAAMAEDRANFEARFAGDPSWGLALLKTSRPREALEKLQKAHTRLLAQLGDDHTRTAETLGVMAMAQAAMGDGEGARTAFSKSLDILLARSRRSAEASAVQAVPGQRLGLVLEAYVDLLTQTRDRPLPATQSDFDAVAEAFRVVEIARSRTVQGALTASAARAAAADPDLADLVRREQDAGRRIEALFGAINQLLATWSGEPDSEAARDLRDRIERLRGARATIMEEIEARFPDYAELIDPQPMTIEDARAVLGPGEVLISTYVGDERTYVWALPRDGEVAFAVVDQGREALAETVALLRAALEPNAQTLGDIPDFDVAAAHDLYRRLLEPVKAGWKEADSLLVVAHGPLGYLPLSLLPTEPVEPGTGEGTLFAGYRDVPWLARDHAVTLLPSVASLRTLRGLPPGDAARKAYAGFGDPLFSKDQMAEAAAEMPATVAELTARGLRTRGLPVRLRAAPDTTELDSAELANLPRLLDTADEIMSTAVVLKADLTEDVFLGAKANEQVVKTMDLSGYKVIAFATHGLVPGDLDGLMQPALALSAPDVAGVEGDGLLTMDEILALKLDADWVVLSACNTGSGEGAGAEAVSGLGRAFFYAGTRTLLVSNWPVETTSAKTLTTDLFRRQAEDPSLTRSEALRQAMSGLIDGDGYVDPNSSKAVFSYAHPIFWAPFSLIGDGGGATVPGS